MWLWAVGVCVGVGCNHDLAVTMEGAVQMAKRTGVVTMVTCCTVVVLSLLAVASPTYAAKLALSPAR